VSVVIEREAVADHFNGLASEYERWKEKASYYYRYVMEGLQEYVPPGRRVLEIGCGTGAILDSLKPSYGLGIDLSDGMIAVAKQKRPHLNFAVGDIEMLQLQESFDHIVIVDLVEHLANLPNAFRQLGRILPNGATLVSSSANPLWAPVLDAAEKLNMKMPEGDHRWPSISELVEVACQAGLETVTIDRRMIFPKAVPFFSNFLNAHFPRRGFLSGLNLIQLVVFKKERTSSS
jgi:ubiquinone/menaquinone biosynthesis C-methylase UbiE